MIGKFVAEATGSSLAGPGRNECASSCEKAPTIIPPSPMSHWVKVGADPLMILYEASQKIIFAAFHLQMDES